MSAGRTAQAPSAPRRSPRRTPDRTSDRASDRTTPGDALGWVLVALPISYAVWNPWGLIGRHEIRLLIGLVAVAVALRVVVRRPTILMPRRWLVGVAFMAVVAASTLAAGDFRTTVIGHADRHLGLIGWSALAIAVVAGSNADIAARRRFRTVLEIVGVIVAALGLAQLVGLTITGELGSGDRITSTFGSATYTGAALALTLPLLIDRAISSCVARSQAVAAAGALTVGLALLLTGSRGAWIGAGVGLTLVLWYHRHQHRTIVLRTSMAAFGAIGTALLLSAPLRDRVASLFQPSSGTAGGRLVLWESGLRTVADRPVLGWGPDRTRAALPPNLPRSFEAEYWDQTVPDRAHNAVLDVAVTAGVIAAGLLVALIVIALRNRPTESDGSFSDWPIWRITLLAHLPHLFFNFVQLDVDMVAAVILGFLLAPAAVAVAMPVAVRVGLSTTATVAAIAGLLLGGGLVVADSVAARGVHAERRGDLDDARSSYSQAVTWSFGDARYHELMARFHRRHGDHIAAIQAADLGAAVHEDDPFYDELAALTRAEAAAIDPSMAADSLSRYEALIDRWPHHGAYFTGIGVAFANTGRFSEAESSFRTAVELTPLSPEPYRNLAELLMSQGRFDEARSVLEAGIRTTVAPEQLTPMLVELP